MTEQRRLAAILVADVVGYSKLIGSDETGTLTQLQALRMDVIEPQIAKHAGRLFKAVGDGFLVEFASAVQAVSCARAIQEANALGRLQLRIGIHVGDVVVQGDDLMGDGVNVAARIESVADPRGIALSRQVHDQVRDKLDLAYIDKGEIELKNIARPVQVFVVGGAKTATQVTALPLPDKPSIAVLPFQNMSGDPEQEYFTDGISEDIITELSRFRELFVIARNSSFTYKGRAVDIKQVGQELGVRYVLEGSIRRSGNRIRITGQLIEASTGSHLWAERYDRVLDDVFDVQEEVTRAIVSAIAPEIAASEQTQALRRKPEDVGAYEIALRAWSDVLVGHQTSDRAKFDSAVAGANRALTTDPNSVLALQTLVYGHGLMGWYHFAPDLTQAHRESAEAAERAISLDPANARNHALKAFAPFMARDYERQSEALVAARRAHALNVNDTFVLYILGNLEANAGDPMRAIDYCQRILRLNPRDNHIHMIYTLLAYACVAARRYADGLAWASRALNDAPRNNAAYTNLIACLVGTGQIEKARAMYQSASERLAPAFARIMAGRNSYSREGDREHSRVFMRVAAGLDPPSAADAVR